MSLKRRINIIVGICSLLIASCATPADKEELSAESVKMITRKVADWQIKTFDDQMTYRAVSRKNQEKLKNGVSLELPRVVKQWENTFWTSAALYIGMDQWRKADPEPQKYTDWLYDIGMGNEWGLGKRLYHADDHAVAQLYESLYEEDKKPEILVPTITAFDSILSNRMTGELTCYNRKQKAEGMKSDFDTRWGWCDALFMAPPSWARLAKLTGEKKYLDFMDEEYHVTYDHLWDKEEHLFFRDDSYFKKREENGEKIFWARGNGWVFGGLALMIPDLPQDWEGKEFYIKTFKEMAASIAKIQREDGTWSMGLLGSPEFYSEKETSGTAFYTYGLAWGINNGLLNRATYEPIIRKSWKALTQCVTEEGLLGYVQPVGAAPGDAYPDKTEVYGIGAFLAAGAEMYKFLSE